MKRIEKTVFLSYRRTNAPWALAICKTLTHEGYDVFFDYTSIASGAFESAIIENIKARAHFLVLLTPSALNRCVDPGDWLRREIETALDTQRNIVPIILESFDFGSPTISRLLTGKLAALRHYNSVGLSVEYFDAAMTKLRDKFLNIPLDAVLHPPSELAQRAVKEQQLAVAAAPVVPEAQLTALDWFERGFGATDIEERLRCYDEAIRLKPDLPFAYCNRGIARRARGDLDGALADYSEAIRQKPDLAGAYSNRGNVRRDRGDLMGALEDYSEALRWQPDEVIAYCNRGIVRHASGDLNGALKDYDEAIRRKPDLALAYNNRGIVRRDSGDLDGAREDFVMAARLRADGGTGR